MVLNNPPGLAPVGNQTVDEGTSIDVALTAPDLEGDTVTFTGSNLPSFVTVTDNGDSTGTLSISPLTGDGGVYPDVVITACDDASPQLCFSETITITVNAVNLDSDGDGVIDTLDQCPGFDDTIDVDLDGIPDCIDPLVDSDGDGVADDLDLCPATPAGEAVDADG
ncbi:MAG TPA: hypothetical protein DDX85_12135, partial [Nitrospiraceae bacterium]|nr:hypothetical protein [Nitrospiraceae bacterium]